MKSLFILILLFGFTGCSSPKTYVSSVSYGKDRLLPESYESYLPKEKKRAFEKQLSQTAKPKENPYAGDQKNALEYEFWYYRGYAFSASGCGFIKFFTSDWNDENRRPILDGWTDGQSAGFDVYLPTSETHSF